MTKYAPPRDSQAEKAPALTALLTRAQEGDAVATNEIFPLVYNELRGLADRYLASERPGQTLQPTALVHEAYLRLVGPGDVGWENRAHFFGAAARAIRRILIDHARARHRLKRGEGERPLPLEAAADMAVGGPDLDILALDEALQRLATIEPRMAEVVQLRFFGGLSVEETASTTGMSASTVAREWQFARLWLHRAMQP